MSEEVREAAAAESANWPDETLDPRSPLAIERAEESAAQVRAVCGLPPDPDPHCIPRGRPVMPYGQ